MRLCALTLFLCAHTAFAQADASASTLPAPFPTGEATALGQQISALTTGPAVVRAHWGIAVTTLDGTPIYGLNEGEFFRPASNAKLFTTAAAMQLLSPDTRVTTAAVAATPLAQNGILHGDMVLRGAGDANISSRHIPFETPAQRKQRIANSPAADSPDPLNKMQTIASAIAARVKEIDGDIIGDDTLWPFEPYANDWTIDDAVWGYGAPVSALTITDNQFELEVTPGTRPGEKATVALQPAIPYYTLDVKVTTVAPKQPASIRIDRDPGSKKVRVVGTVAVGQPYSTEIAIDDPAEYAAIVLKSLLETDGVKISGIARARHRLSDDTEGFNHESRQPLPSLPRTPVSSIDAPRSCEDACPTFATLTSPTLAEDMAVTLKVSQNLHAELLLRRLGKTYGTDGSTAQGSRVVRQFLLNIGLDGDDFILYDGSGLSSHDLVTPRATAKLLAYATRQPWFAQWRAGFPIGGEDGTLNSRFSQPPLKDHLFAKTGTLGESRALSGYLDCASGKTIIFSVMVDNHAPNTPAERDAMDHIVAAIAANN